MIGGKGHCTIHNRHSLIGIGSRLINDRYLARGIKAIVFIQRDRYGRCIPLGISNRRNVIRDISGILACVNWHSFFGNSHTRQPRCGNRNIPIGYGYLRGNSTQSDSLGACIHCGIGSVSAFVLVAIGNATRFQVVLSIGIEALDRHFIILNVEHRHGKLIIRAIVILIIPGKAGIHIGEIQCLYIELRFAGLCNVDLITLCQVHRAAAQIVIPTVGVIMSIQEDNIQAGGACLIHYIKEVIGVHTVSVITGTHGIMQGQMGNHEDGFTITCCDFFIQVISQSLRCFLNRCFIAVIPHIVIFIDDIYAVLFGIMGTAF